MEWPIRYQQLKEPPPALYVTKISSLRIPQIQKLFVVKANGLEMS